MQKKPNLLSGMRPTGRLHLGHLSVLEEWASLQDAYNCFYCVADWHALTTAYDDPKDIRENIRQIAIDWLSAGLDPQKSAIFVQSHVREHAELHLLLSMIINVSWLERVPTYKDQIKQLSGEGKDIATYGFLGYPLLQAADILIYRAAAVPVGEDQLPHLELCREVARRFNNLYQTDILPEPQSLLAKIKLLPGIDNRKMSKSYQNFISLSAAPETVREKVSQMVTDPARIRKTDLGRPEICTVYTYHTFYNQEEKEEVHAGCSQGTIGCVACKKRLAEKMNLFLAPILEKRAALEADAGAIDDILAAGDARASACAAENMRLIRDAMKL
ncbi:MAG: tryptophan--tRNA ligase [Clostridiales bacterium]|nr:tryptophan--tRNA ligase [Clostridiales bacterium]